MKSTNKRYQFTQTLVRMIIGGLLLLSLGNTSPVYAVDDPEFTIVQTDSGDFADGKTGSTITISIMNNGGGATNGSQVTVINTLPSRLSATAINAGAEWVCVLATLTCTSNAIIGVDQPYSDIILTVNVAVNAPELITNTVAISGGGDVTPDNNESDHDITVITKPDLIVTGYTLLNESKDIVIAKPEPNTSFYIRMTIKNQGGGATGIFYPGVFLDSKPNYGPDTDPFGRVSNWSGYRRTPIGALSGVGCMYYDPANLINPLTTEVDPERGNYTRAGYNDALTPGAETSLDILIGYPNSDITYSGSEYDPYRNGLSGGAYNVYLYADPSCSAGDEESNEGNNSYGPISLTVGNSPLTSPWIGSVSISSAQNIVTIGRPHTGTEVMTYNGDSSGSTEAFVPMLFKNMWSGYNAALYIQNLSTTNPANLTLTYYDTNGAVTCTKSDTLNASSSRGYWMPGETCLPASWVGSVYVTSDQNIVAIGRPHIEDQITTYNGFPSGSTKSYIPMLFSNAFGGTYNAAVYLQNVTTISATFSIKFYDDSGNLVCTKSGLIAPFSSQGYWLPSLICNSTMPLPAGWVGSAVIEADQNIVAVGRLHIGAQITAYSSFVDGGLTMNLPMLFSGAFGNYNSALYVQNIGNTAATVTIKFYDTNGNLSCTKVDSLATLASKGYWLPTLTCSSGSLPSGWSGSVAISSTQNIVAVGRPHLGNEIMTYTGVASGSSSSYIPMLFNNAFGTYNAAFYIQNLDSITNASVTVRFYDSSGNLSCTLNDSIKPQSSKGYWLPGISCYPP